MSLSIPYWDFLVLNLTTLIQKINGIIRTFNSLLGFSSFESYNVYGKFDTAKLKLSIPYWDFLVLNRSSRP